jgi:hypothetical protein
MADVVETIVIARTVMARHSPTESDPSRTSTTVIEQRVAASRSTMFVARTVADRAVAFAADGANRPDQEHARFARDAVVTKAPWRQHGSASLAVWRAGARRGIGARIGVEGS